MENTDLLNDSAFAFLSEDPENLEDAKILLKGLRRTIEVLSVVYKIPLDKIEMTVDLIKDEL